jgi:hypothetical protein
MKKRSIRLIISCLTVVLSFTNVVWAQNKWLKSEEYLSIQEQSYNLIKTLEDLLNNIVVENQIGSISEYYRHGSPNQIFQNNAVLVINDIKPKSKSYLSIEISSYLNHWYNHLKNNDSHSGGEFRITIENIFISPVFLDGKEALSKVYYNKIFHSTGHTDTLSKFAIIRSSMQNNDWVSLISGIDLVNEKVEINEEGTVKKLQSVRNELGVLTETIKKDSTIISYKNFWKYITPYYSRTQYSNKLNSVYYFDKGLYLCKAGNYNVEIKKDSMSIVSPQLSGIFHNTGFKLENETKGFDVSLKGDNHLKVIYPGFFDFLMNSGVAGINSKEDGLALYTSNSSDSLALNTANALQIIEQSNSVIEVTNPNYKLDFYLYEDRIELDQDFSITTKHILTSNTKLHNMELIRYESESGEESFYIDKNEVTVAEFAKFVNATGYLTEVEKRGWSFVVKMGFDAGKKYTHSGDLGISKHLKLEKGYSVNWRCDEFGKLINLKSQDSSRPVIHVNYYDALNYCLWAGKQLPNRKEMLIAADDILSNGNFRDYVMYSENSGGKINLVRQKLESKLYIWDILGNVYEWCDDWACDENVQSCNLKYVFGGFWGSPPFELTINKENEVASTGSSLIGFRGVIRKLSDANN